MKKIISLLSLLLVSIGVFSQQSLQSPAEFLGYELGDKFTRHHRIVEYYEHVAAALPNVKLEQYGTTNEGRPLIIAIFSSPENFNRLDEIRIENLKKAKLADGAADASNKTAIVWLSYNVHGNESVSSEATMQTLYELANPDNAKTQEWLKNTVVIMDPCINPDGRDRYANFYNQYTNKVPNVDLNSKEHREPWPGGRTNHYFFDLNRDWAWQSQVESQGRIKKYNQWMPHVHVDFHEQGMNGPYYFAPAAEPYHERITPWQREFQNMIGKNHAKYFDKEGWLYFTKEVFDLLYPSYGDTYPMFNGAIGMTYEKGGGGRAGLAGIMENGDTVKLSDRILHHHTTGLSTVEVASVNASRMVDEFTSFFSNAVSSPTGKYKTYVIKGSNHVDKLNTLKSWLDVQNIQYGTAASTKKLTGFNYKTGANSSVSIASNDLVISAYQPKSMLANILFEPRTALSDSLTYDITAWSLPYVYDLEAYALTERLNVSGQHQSPTVQLTKPSNNPYGYIVKYESFDDVQLVADLNKKGIKLRVAEKPFQLDGKKYNTGTVLALRWDNEHNPKFDAMVNVTSEKFLKELTPAYTGLVEQGKDFGSGWVRFLDKPNVALIGGEQTSSGAFGELWYFMEQELDYPVTVLGTDYISRVNLDKYNVLIVPNGNYRIFDEDYRKKLSSWVQAGGTLVLMENALNSFVDKDGFGLKKYADEKEKKAVEEEEKKPNTTVYAERRREYAKQNIPGAIFKAKIDNTHPLAFGYPDYYYTLKRSTRKFAFLESGWNVGTINSRADLISGFAGSKAKEKVAKSLLFGVEQKGSGSIIYMVDDPVFRAFWYNGKMLLGNAIFMN